MEQLEVPSRSYIIRWVDCAPGNTIHWSIKPHKKSLNFGLFRHPGNTSGSSSSASVHPPPTARSEESTTATVKESRSRPLQNRNSGGDAIDKIHAAGLLDVYWHGKCEAEKVTTGTYQVKGQGGMFALVFDNTFSKQVAKTATFVLLTYPSNQPPPASHALHHADSQPSMGATPNNVTSRSTLTASSQETLSVHSHLEGHRDDQLASSTSGFQTGVLKKRKRKRHQGYARRFFSLDFTSSTLSYYLNRESSALRGAIPLSLAAISASQKDREICIDSGAEIWHLRANTDKDWEMWKTALERAAQNAAKAGTGNVHGLRPPQDHTEQGAANDQHVIMEERGWAGVEALVGRVAGVRDAVRRLAAQSVEASTLGVSEAASSSTSIVSTFSLDSQDKATKRPFWKRKQSTPTNVPTVNPPRDNGRKSIGAATAMLGSAAAGVAQPFSPHGPQDISFNLQALLADLDSVVSDFTGLIAQNKQRRWLHHHTSAHLSQNNATVSRISMESTASDEFFDAEDALDGADRVVMLNNDDDDDRDGVESVAEENEATDDEESDLEYDNFDQTLQVTPGSHEPTPKDGRVKDLTPLPLDLIPRRQTVPEAKMLPPSLIGFLRKNVGKDLSTIAMPVSANEPISLLQRLSEQLEYSELLDQAVAASVDNGERILYITAFAISSFSGARIKERAIRKPFNPMLGETFELVREDKGFRFLSEKVSHRPVIMACHADSAKWTFSQSPQPTQKFWGKSAELITSGRVRIYFPSTNDRYSYTVATSFLRNIIAGEKYVEPTGSMHIHNETTGEKAVVTFKMNKGMFSGRSEEVSVQAFDGNGDAYPTSLTGKWTEHLFLVDSAGNQQNEIWRIGSTVDGAPSRYGFTKFAAQLNEITSIEKGSLPPTDSRLRPDQRMVENGELDDAEEMKLRLEEAQRARRKEMEESGENWVPKWFRKVREYADEEVWRIVDEGEEQDYWKVREKGAWTAEGGGLFDV
ncbi:Oxysterol-binding protein-domain-containing protein [Trichophaea hybrida]|nr:Oxysterol-binding protein-domain-containing protein [Trichophaea hybrida]